MLVFSKIRYPQMGFLAEDTIRRISYARISLVPFSVLVSPLLPPETPSRTCTVNVNQHVNMYH